MTSAEFLAIVGNREVIAINQDGTQVQGTNVTLPHAGGGEVWAKRLPRGAVAVLLMNAALAPVARKVAATWKQLGLADDAVASVRDVWAAKELGGWRIL